MGDKGGGGLQLSAIVGFLCIKHNDITMLHIQKVTLLDSVFLFGMQMNAECCLLLQDEGHCTEPPQIDE